LALGTGQIEQLIERNILFTPAVNTGTNAFWENPLTSSAPHTLGRKIC